MKNRWTSLLAGVLIQIILGGIYAWSPLLSLLGNTYGLTQGQASFIFGLCIASFTVTMVFAGRFLVNHGPQLTATIGALLFTGGYLIASYSGGSYLVLLLGLGIITGGGIGFGYVCPLTVGMKWFPHKRGLVVGVSAAGFGSGAIILSQVAEHFLSLGMPILAFFRWWGLSAGLLLLLASLMLANPEPTKRVKKRVAGVAEIVSIPFILCTVGIFAGTFAGLLINGNLTPILLERGIKGSQALRAISLFAIGNAGGRVAWGYLFDRLGSKSIPISLFGFLLSSLPLFLDSPWWLLLLAILFIGFFFGSNFVIYALSIARYFGQTLFSSLYPLCFVAYGVTGFIAPAVGGYFKDRTGSFQIALGIASALVAFVAILTLVKRALFVKPTHR